jgi:hypothetical protein
MEIIPAADESNDASASAVTSPALEVGPAAHEPLGVELLEDRVLLAADAAAPPPVEPLPSEPAALVAAPTTGAAGVHERALTAEVTDARAEVSRSGDPASPAPRVETVEMPHEAIETAGPESGEQSERLTEDLGESESGKNEFGLATIEPEANKALRTHESAKKLPSGEALTSFTDESEETDPAGEGSPVEASPDAVRAAEQPVLDTRVLAEWGRERPAVELGASLAEETAIAPLLDELPKSESPTIQADAAEQIDDGSAVTDQAGSRYQADQSYPADNLGQPANGETTASERAGGAAHPDAAASLREEPAAHDAVFAGGRGVEAVIEHGPHA